MRHAIGEVLLIVVGVSLALTANSWYQDTQIRKDEFRELQQLKGALEADVADFEVLIGELQKSERDLQAVWDAANSETLSEEFVGPISQLRVWRAAQIRSGPYEELKNRGFSLISNASIRSALIDLYERMGPEVRDVGAADRDYTSNLIGPYLQENFVITPDGPWTPAKGYAVLQRDVHFRNLVAGKLARTRRVFLAIPQTFVTAAKKLLVDIDSELAKLAD